MNKKDEMRPVRILLVEDNPGDARLVVEALKEGNVINQLFHARDGIEALEFLHGEPPFTEAIRPDIILLDLNMPRLDGRGLLAKIKADDKLKTIPVVVLTTSRAEEDIAKSYELQASCYVPKPVDIDDFMEVMRQIETFWLESARLPSLS